MFNKFKNSVKLEVKTKEEEKFIFSEPQVPQLSAK